jgi:small-conductance mechanosensitive channel
MSFQHWIPIERIVPLIGLESFVIAICTTLLSWVFYKLFLSEISLKRHLNLRLRLLKLLSYLCSSSIFSAACWQIREHPELGHDWMRGASYFGVLGLALGSIAVIFLAQILLYLYLYFANMRAGFPRLIANIFTLVFATTLLAWLTAEIFAIRILPLLATSAIFSVVLGLALQDTLGNLFSGLALQLDSPYLIGDWVEVHTGAQSWTGQIQEISWRATLLQGFSGELITIPNRTIAQSQVIMYATPHRFARRNQAFRIPFGASIAKAKEILLEVVLQNKQVVPDTPPLVLIIDVCDSWTTLKIFYSINDFGAQYRIGDDILSRAILAFQEAGIELAHPTLNIRSGVNDRDSLSAITLAHLEQLK